MLRHNNISRFQAQHVHYTTSDKNPGVCRAGSCWLMQVACAQIDKNDVQVFRQLDTYYCYNSHNQLEGSVYAAISSYSICLPLFLLKRLIKVKWSTKRSVLTGINRIKRTQESKLYHLQKHTNKPIVLYIVLIHFWRLFLFCKMWSSLRDEKRFRSDMLGDTLFWSQLKCPSSSHQWSS